MKSYRRENVPLARVLRNTMTSWERKLWYQFLRTYPLRFQRQKPLGPYIVDFYCARAQLAVELDGGGHYEPEQICRDQRRTQALNAMGISVLRICNTDLDRNFTGVCEAIDQTVQSASKKPFPETGMFERDAQKPPSDEGGGTAEP